jgi:hypothetical protein
MPGLALKRRFLFLPFSQGDTVRGICVGILSIRTERSQLRNEFVNAR